VFRWAAVEDSMQPMANTSRTRTEHNRQALEPSPLPWQPPPGKQSHARTLLAVFEQTWHQAPGRVGHAQHHLREAARQHAQQVVVGGGVLLHALVVVAKHRQPDHVQGDAQRRLVDVDAGVRALGRHASDQLVDARQDERVLLLDVLGAEGDGHGAADGLPGVGGGAGEEVGGAVGVAPGGAGVGGWGGGVCF